MCKKTDSVDLSPEECEQLHREREHFRLRDEEANRVDLPSLFEHELKQLFEDEEEE